jgi:hypothetical protein
MTGPASIVPLGVANGENLFTLDPALHGAQFTGTLTPDRGNACMFTVSWFSDGTPPVFAPPNGAAGTADTRLEQTTDVTLSSDCWGVLAQGAGKLWEHANAFGSADLGA